jgi:hypothetical protein
MGVDVDGLTLDLDITVLNRPKSYAEAKNAGMPVFKIFSDGEIKAAPVQKDGVPRVLIIASTNQTDLVQDVMTLNALEEMRLAAIGRTFFLNHVYTVPEDVFGVIEAAEIVEMEVEDPQTKKKIKALCLIFTVVVEILNPRALMCYEMIKAGRVRLGASIGVLILDCAPDKKTGKMLINSVYFLECSLVGIPANQFSWVQNALKALKSLLASKGIEVMNEENENGTATVPAVTDGAVARKGLFADEVAEAKDTVYIWELCDILFDTVYDIIWRWYDKEVEDPEPLLQEVFAEFTSESMYQLQKQWGFGEKEASADADEAASLKAALLEAKAARFAGLLTKAGARNSKSDTKRLQGIHDLANELGASCPDAAAATKAAPSVEIDATAVNAVVENAIKEAKAEAEKAYQTVAEKHAQEVEAVKQAQALLEKDKADLQTQRDEALQKSAQWEATAAATLLSLKNYSKQPLPRAGMGN